MRQVEITMTGGPEVMNLVNRELPPPAEGEVRLRHTAIGLNFIDIYHRTGLYPVPLPSGLGQEGAGVIESVGPGVTRLKAGDRVAYGNGPIGAYAEARNIPATKVSKLPDAIADETAAAMMLKGMTARYLIREVYKVGKGTRILAHAAAGGVGTILCQWAAALGAEVIGTVGSPEKAELARRFGCHHVINYRSEDVAQRVRAITGGQGVDVVYDGVGQATLMGSLDSLRPRGLLVSFGNASGPVTNFNLGLLAARGSLMLTRPTLGTFIATPELLEETAQDLFRAVASGQVKIAIDQRYALADIRKAHEDLESRRTTATTVIIP